MNCSGPALRQHVQYLPLSPKRCKKKDPWDGRISREEQFRAKLKEFAPNSEIQDLDPILDNLRGVKDAREIAILRDATRITGLGIMEAMRDARPGMHEYELQADCEFVFKKFGSYGPAYFALIATGQNTYYSHYHQDTAQLQDGDLVQLDYAPDYKNYASDVTRVFPANGKFTPRQREFFSGQTILSVSIHFLRRVAPRSSHLPRFARRQCRHQDFC